VFPLTFVYIHISTNSFHSPLQPFLDPLRSATSDRTLEAPRVVRGRAQSLNVCLCSLGHPWCIRYAAAALFNTALVLSPRNMARAGILISLVQAVIICKFSSLSSTPRLSRFASVCFRILHAFDDNPLPRTPFLLSSYSTHNAASCSSRRIHRYPYAAAPLLLAAVCGSAVCVSSSSSSLSEQVVSAST
jgi:hypothetical protein